MSLDPSMPAGCDAATTGATSWPWLRYVVAFAILIGLIAAGQFLHGHDQYGRAASFTLITGALFGILLQRSRFCFFCCLTDLFDLKNAAPVLGLIAALVVGSLGYMVVFGAWIADPSYGYLPPKAHIAPIGWHLCAGGLAFGLGMAFSGSCISAHLYRLGEGSLLAPVAILSSMIGFALGFLSWNFIYLNAVVSAPLFWIPQHIGYAKSTALYLGVFTTLAIVLFHYLAPKRTTGEDFTLPHVAELVFIHRWPTWLGGIGIGVLGAFAYLRVAPLGVTAEIGRLSRMAADTIGILPGRLEGLDQMAGCSTASAPQLFSTNAIFVLSLVAASFASALIAGQFQPSLPPLRKVVWAIIGGILLGWGAMISLGCTIGTLLSGISAFSLSGWLFLFAMVVGVRLGLIIRNRYIL